MKTATYDLPTHWAYYLTYGEDDDMPEDEKKEIARFLENEGLNDSPDISEEHWFASRHDATDYGVKVCHVTTYTFIVRDTA